MSAAEGAKDFIREMVAADLAAGRHGGRVVTRFPPEPNGYLHVGHARAILVNWGIASEFGGTFHLRFDDTNPSAEEERYVRAMQEDVRWLGADWGENLYFASDYFEQLYGYALELIRKGLAFVCDLTPEQMREYGGQIGQPGRESPYRTRPVEENLDLFERMRAGEFEPGARVLRAKIDMASSVLPMRDPILWRIQKTHHHRTGDDWNVYPLYDFAHPLSDALEGITHSLCSLEFADHRPLYDWMVENTSVPSQPRQTEFARLNLSHTVVSKRVLRGLVEGGFVEGWDDPRMPTLAAMRRRGYPARAIRDFNAGVGITKRENLIELARLEHHVRDVLNKTAPRAMGVLRPLRVVIENFPEDEVEWFDAVNNPEDPAAGTRKLPFSRELYIERDDFLEDPPRKFFRLAPGREVRLRYACLIRCVDVVKDESGEIVEVRCTWDPDSRGGDAPDGRKVKATLHWVSAAHALPAQVRLYGPLFSVADPMAELEEGEDVTRHLAPDSLEVLDDARVEAGVAEAVPGAPLQLERLGYFCLDPDSSPGRPVVNRTVTLRDQWAKAQRRG
ncbi:MAG: glutamine--tRNA ligase/YqeY domain fusion protein [Myxococcota bacterium]|nr:glutamine--tRNA ligase/YqeY domain fusion protein [Myxococcota bacterium]